VIGKSMRALQPLRVLNRFKGLQRITATLIESLPGVAAVFALLLLFWLCFAIIGVESFSGALKRCVPSAENVYELVPGVEDRAGCLAAGYHWDNPAWNFDHIFHGMETLCGPWLRPLVGSSPDCAPACCPRSK
jgi:hypothetical protein